MNRALEGGTYHSGQLTVAREVIPIYDSVEGPGHSTDLSRKFNPPADKNFQSASCGCSRSPMCTLLIVAISGGLFPGVCIVLLYGLILIFNECRDTLCRNQVRGDGKGRFESAEQLSS